MTPEVLARPLVKVADFGLSVRLLGQKNLKIGGDNKMGHINATWAGEKRGVGRKKKNNPLP